MRVGKDPRVSSETVDRDAFGHVGVHAAETGGHRRLGVRRRSLDSPGRQAAGKDLVTQNLFDRSGVVSWIATRHPETGAAVINKRAQTTNVGRHDRHATGCGFEGYESERFAP